MNLTQANKSDLELILNKALVSNLSGDTTLENLLSLFNLEEKKLLDSIIKIDPHDYGFKGAKLSGEPNNIKIIKIDKNIATKNGEYALDSNIYIAENIYKKFREMNRAFAFDFPNRELLIGSAYRAPGFQIITLLYLLIEVHNFDIGKTLKQVALPQYSQHCSQTHTAIDIMNIDGEPMDDQPDKFSETIEYIWLLANATKFGFVESYPKGNKDGIMWEPWHWQFTG